MRHRLLTALCVAIITAGTANCEDHIKVARAGEPPVSSVRSIQTFTLNGVKLFNNTVIQQPELDRVVAPYRGKDVAYEQLEIIRNELTKILIDKGYVSSGVIITDQEVKDGTVVMTVLQGALTTIDIEGNRYFKSSYLASRIQRGSEKPLNMNRLQEALQLLQQDDRIKKISAELKPGDKPGETTLKAKIVDEFPARLFLDFGNNGSPSTGSYHGNATLVLWNLLGYGDTLESKFGMSDGTKDYSARYAVPLNAADTTVEAYFRKGESTIVEDLFKELNIESTTDTYGVRISHPLYRTMQNEVKLSLAGEYRSGTSKLLGEGFSFSAGEDEGKSKASILRFGQQYVNRGTRHVMALNSTVSAGQTRPK